MNNGHGSMTRIFSPRSQDACTCGLGHPDEVGCCDSQTVSEGTMLQVAEIGGPAWHTVKSHGQAHGTAHSIARGQSEKSEQLRPVGWGLARST